MSGKTIVRVYQHRPGGGGWDGRGSSQGSGGGDELAETPGAAERTFLGVGKRAASCCSHDEDRDESETTERREKMFHHDILSGVELHRPLCSTTLLDAVFPHGRKRAARGDGKVRRTSDRVGGLWIVVNVKHQVLDTDGVIVFEDLVPHGFEGIDGFFVVIQRVSDKDKIDLFPVLRDTIQLLSRCCGPGLVLFLSFFHIVECLIFFPSCFVNLYFFLSFGFRFSAFRLRWWTHGSMNIRMPRNGIRTASPLTEQLWRRSYAIEIRQDSWAGKQ